MVERYFQPQSLEEALKLFARYGRRAKILAGGTDIVPLLKRGEEDTECLISISAIEELKAIEYDATTGLTLGAGVTYASLLDLPEVKEKYPALVDAASQVGGVQVRNLATLAGNLCHGSPSADMAPPLLALDASVVLASRRGRRSLPLQDFFRGPNRTALKAGEMVVSIMVPPLDGSAGAAYVKLGQRSAMEIALVGVAAWIRKDGHRCQEARIALGAVAPRPIRAKRAEQALAGKEFSPAALEEAAKLAAREAKPISDVRCSAQYRREMVAVLTRRALLAAWQRAGSG